VGEAGGEKRVVIEVRVLAYTFPAICIVMGALLLSAGQSKEGVGLITVGAAFQALYLALRYRH